MVLSPDLLSDIHISLRAMRAYHCNSYCKSLMNFNVKFVSLSLRYLYGGP